MKLEHVRDAAVFYRPMEGYLLICPHLLGERPLDIQELPHSQHRQIPVTAVLGQGPEVAAAPGSKAMLRAAPVPEGLHSRGEIHR